MYSRTNCILVSLLVGLAISFQSHAQTDQKVTLKKDSAWTLGYSLDGQTWLSWNQNQAPSLSLKRLPPVRATGANRRAKLEIEGYPALAQSGDQTQVVFLNNNAISASATGTLYPFLSKGEESQRYSELALEGTRAVDLTTEKENLWKAALKKLEVGTRAQYEAVADETQTTLVVEVIANAQGKVTFARTDANGRKVIEVALSESNRAAAIKNVLGMELNQQCTAQSQGAEAYSFVRNASDAVQNVVRLATRANCAEEGQYSEDLGNFLGAVRVQNAEQTLTLKQVALPGQSLNGSAVAGNPTPSVKEALLKKAFENGLEFNLEKFAQNLLIGPTEGADIDHVLDDILKNYWYTDTMEAKLQKRESIVEDGKKVDHRGNMRERLRSYISGARSAFKQEAGVYQSVSAAIAKTVREQLWIIRGEGYVNIPQETFSSNMTFAARGTLGAMSAARGGKKLTLTVRIAENGKFAIEGYRWVKPVEQSNRHAKREELRKTLFERAGL